MLDLINVIIIYKFHLMHLLVIPHSLVSNLACVPHLNKKILPLTLSFCNNFIEMCLGLDVRQAMKLAMKKNEEACYCFLITLRESNLYEGRKQR